MAVGHERDRYAFAQRAECSARVRVALERRCAVGAELGDELGYVDASGSAAAEGRERAVDDASLIGAFAGDGHERGLEGPRVVLR